MNRGIIQAAISQPTRGLELEYKPAFTLCTDAALAEEHIGGEPMFQDPDHQASDWLTYFLRAI